MKTIPTIALILCTSNVFAQIPGTIDPRLHVDQFGYLPAAQKIAVIASPQVGYNAPANLTPDSHYRVKRCYDNATIFEAPISPWNGGAVHQQSGDKVWWFDFSTLRTNGCYYLYDSLNNLRSYRFSIADCAYEDPLKHASRTYYYQRCGVGKKTPFADSLWADALPCHIGNLQDRVCYNIQNPVPSSAKDLHGGWHDAGDYNKYVTFSYGALMNLLLALKENPSRWSDDTNIPESGNGIPDLLDEIKYELDWLLRMQQTNGAVLSVVGVPNFAGGSPPSTDLNQRFYGPATTAATFSAASSFALAARQFQVFPSMATYATTLQNAAVNAWNWGVSNPNAVFYNAGVVAAGENQPDAYETNMRKIAAACCLFAQTGDIVFRNYFDNQYSNAHLIQWSFAYPYEPHTQDMLLLYCTLPNTTTSVKNTILEAFSNSMQSWNADNLPSFTDHIDAYMAYLRDDNYTWGSNQIKANQANMFFAMNHAGLNTSNAARYKNAGAGFLHYLHGVNPTGYCFLSNMGNFGAEFSIPTLYHGWFDHGTVWDDVNTSSIGPAPGFLPGGPNPSFHPDGNCACVIAPPENQPIQKSFKAWNTGWPQNSWELNEVAIYTQAAYLRLLANVLDESQSPPSCAFELPVEIVGSSNVCADGTYYYNVVEVIGSVYVWQVTGGTIVSGQGTPAVYVLWDTTAPTPSITIHQTIP
jgi:hypothetical protein